MENKRRSACFWLFAGRSENKRCINPLLGTALLIINISTAKPVGRLLSSIVHGTMPFGASTSIQYGGAQARMVEELKHNAELGPSKQRQ